MEKVYKYKDRYKSVMIKQDLKEEMDKTIGDFGKKMTYSDLIWELIKQYKNDK